MTIDAHLTQKQLSKRGKTMQKYKQQILEPNLCSHHRKTPLLFRPHHSGCQKFRVFFSPKDELFSATWRGGGGGVGVGGVCVRARTAESTQENTLSARAGAQSEQIVSHRQRRSGFSESRKEKKKKNGGWFGACGFKKDWKQKPLWETVSAARWADSWNVIGIVQLYKAGEKWV